MLRTVVTVCMLLPGWEGGMARYCMSGWVYFQSEGKGKLDECSVYFVCFLSLC